MTTWWDFRGLDSENNTEDDDEFFSASRSYYGKRYKSSLGWSSSKLTDTTSYYSKSWRSFDYGVRSEEDRVNKERLILLTRAYKSVRDMVVILDFPFNVDVELSNFSPGSHAAGTRRIQVPSDVIDRSDYSDEDKINIICGLGTHEAAHLKYTELRVYNYYCKSVSKGEQFFTNLIEDHRIEDKLLSERPGYLDLIEESNNFRYVKLKELISSVAGKFPTNLVNFLSSVIKFVRFPDKLDKDTIKKYDIYFKRIKEILSQNCQFTKDSCIIGYSLYYALRDILSELKLNPDSLDDIINTLYPGDRCLEFTVRYGKDVDSHSPLTDRSISSALKGGSSRLFSELISGKLEFGDGYKTFIEKPEGNKAEYLSLKRDIQKYIPGIKKLIRGTDKNYEFSIHGCREGLLDTNKLAEAYQGVPQVYIRKGKVSTNKTTVCVLIDQSGSMSWGRKSIIAKQAAILLNESLKDSPGVDLYIYGHTADMKTPGDTMIYSYREGSKYCPKFALSAANALGENRDGTAIYEVAKRVRKFTQEDCIMFVLSDGEPAASGYYGYPAFRHVHDKVKEVENMGFTVIQVSIDSVHNAREMFDNVISLEYDLANFPKRLSQVIKKAIVKNKRTTVS